MNREKAECKADRCYPPIAIASTKRSNYFQPYGGGCLRVLSGESVTEAIKVLQAQGYL